MKKFLIGAASAAAVLAALLFIFSYIKGVPFPFLKKEEEVVDDFDYTAGDLTRQTAEGPFFEMPRGAVHEIPTEQTCVLVSALDPELALDTAGEGITVGTPFVLMDRTDSESQRFMLLGGNNSVYEMISQKCELCVTVSGEPAAACLGRDEGSEFGEWQMQPNEDGTFTFINLVTMQALDVSGGIAEAGNPVNLADVNGTDAQKFYIIPAEEIAHPDDGNYTITGVLSESLAFGAGEDPDADPAVRMSSLDGSARQRWNFIYSGDGWYRIENEETKRSLDISGGTLTQSYFAGSDYELYRIERNENGTVVLVNKALGALEASGGYAWAGNTISAAEPDGSFEQMWLLMQDLEAAERVFSIDDTTNGDAKLYGDYVVSARDDVIRYFSISDFTSHELGVTGSWIACDYATGVILTADWNRSINLIRTDGEMNILENRQLMTYNDGLTIDPALWAVDNGWYFTLTHITGTVNRNDPALENGNYQIDLYFTPDFQTIQHVSAVESRNANLEDVDLSIEDGVICCVYEEETLDEQPSSIILRRSFDNGATWTDRVELLTADADHEPARFLRKDWGFRLYYSCDMDQLGQSYNGAKAYYADYDADLTPINLNRPIILSHAKGILFYDIVAWDDGIRYLYAYNKLTENDIVMDRNAA